jgi:hypothetical protein
MNSAPNVKIDRSEWSRDSFRGKPEDLIALGVLTELELVAHADRAPGYTVFLPDGAPCPPLRRAWREPGYKTVLACDNGDYIVQVTVSRDEQATRRAAKKAAEHEEREQRLNLELAERGATIVPNRVKHESNYWCESWEGTKEQLQASAIGVGLRFPGEPGASRALNCACPLGFAVEIKPHFDDVKAAAGVFLAISRYAEFGWDLQTEVFSYAPGVLREVRLIDRDIARYVGAGVVPSLDLFPGQPGRNKQRCKYRDDFTPSSCANRQSWALTIMRRGKDRFEVEVPLPENEAAERAATYKLLAKEHDAASKRAREEREQLRAASWEDASEDGVNAFRKHAEEYAQWGLHMIEIAFTDDKGLYTFDSDVLDELSGAFAAVRDAVHTAEVLKNPVMAQRLRERKRAIAAKTDLGLQAFLQQVSRPSRD